MQTLIILVRNPVAGHTKTRLAASVGHPKALRMYARLVEHTRLAAAGLKNTRVSVLYSDHLPTDSEWDPDHFELGVQTGNDLGERMTNAFAATFAAGSRRAVIIGSDCPGVTTELLKKAFAALNKDPVVIGPAEDGGYYLLGLDAPRPELFQDIPWSTDRVAELTQQRAREGGLSVGKLPTLRDVDYLEDWLSYGWAVPE